MRGEALIVVGETQARDESKDTLACVEAVVVFEDSTPHRLLEALRPDVLVKGGTYTTDEVVGRELVEAYGGEVRVTGEIDGISTTRIVKSLEEQSTDDAVVPLSTELRNGWREAG